MKISHSAWGMAVARGPGVKRGRGCEREREDIKGRDALRRGFFPVGDPWSRTDVEVGSRTEGEDDQGGENLRERERS